MNSKNNKGNEKNEGTITLHSIKIPVGENSKEYYFTIQNLEISSDNLKTGDFDKNLKTVLDEIANVRSDFNGFIQLFEFGNCFGIDHVKYAIYHAVRNILKKKMISNIPENELLLYLSAQRQISKAFDIMGILPSDFTDAGLTKDLLIISEKRDIIEDKVKQLDKRWKLKPIVADGTKSKEKIIELTKNYGINISEIGNLNMPNVLNQINLRFNEKLIKLSIENLN